MAGTAQTFVVKNLTREQTYFFAARVLDNSGNLSGMSNVTSRQRLSQTRFHAVVGSSAAHC